MLNRNPQTRTERQTIRGETSGEKMRPNPVVDSRGLRSGFATVLLYKEDKDLKLRMVTEVQRKGT